MIYQKYLLLGLFICLSFVNSASAETTLQSNPSRFADCHPHNADGTAPSFAKNYYSVKSDPQTSEAYIESAVPRKSHKTLKVIIEDIEFTTYKCWDTNGNLTGMDIETVAQIAYESGYKYIEFIPRPWSTVYINGVKSVSLLQDLINGVGDLVIAGMSMTPDREKVAHMIGPSYRAGKLLIANTDNPKIKSKINALQKVPETFEPLRGLVVLIQKTTVRADFFHRLKEIAPDLVGHAVLDDSNKVVGYLDSKNKLVSYNPSKDKLKVLLVIETDTFDHETELLRNGFKPTPTTLGYGVNVDLLMVDTGSVEPHMNEGLIGGTSKVEIVTDELADSIIGDAFGQGDGISIRMGDKRIPAFTTTLAKMIVSGRINKMVLRYFKDKNTAVDWATKYLQQYQNACSGYLD